MSAEDDKKYKKTALLRGKEIDQKDETDDESGESGQGGKSGQIEFRDFLGSHENIRDDLLSFEEKKRLLSSHADLNQNNVKKQKEKIDNLQALRDGKLKVSLREFRQMSGTGYNSQFQEHPRLSQYVRLHDQQVNEVPGEQIANTNEAPRNELENQYRLNNVPNFSPKPKSTPRLTR